MWWLCTSSISNKGGVHRKVRSILLLFVTAVVTSMPDFLQGALCVTLGQLVVCSVLGWVTQLPPPPSPPGGSPPSCDSLRCEVWQVANVTSCVQVHVTNCMVLLLSFIFFFCGYFKWSNHLFHVQVVYSINNGLSMGCHFLWYKRLWPMQIKSNHAFIIIYKGNTRGYL